MSPSQSSSLLPLHSTRVMSIHPEGTFGRLRYSLGGDRPSQTTHLTWSAAQFMGQHELQKTTRVVFHGCLHQPHKAGICGSHLCYARRPSQRDQTIVKLHGVFLSCRG